MKRWDDKSKPKIQVDEPREEREDLSGIVFKPKEFMEPPSPAPREILLTNKITRDDKPQPVVKSVKDEKLLAQNKTAKEEKSPLRSPKDEKPSKKDKKKDKESKNKESNDANPSSERIIIGGEDSARILTSKSRLSNEVLNQFDGKSREVSREGLIQRRATISNPFFSPQDLIELTLQLQREVADKKKRLVDLEDYIDSLLLRVIESSPRLLQNPYQISQRRLSSPGHQ